MNNEEKELRSKIVRPASCIVEIYSPKTGARFTITGHGFTAVEALKDAAEAVKFGIENYGLSAEFPDDFQNQYGCIVRKPPQTQLPNPSPIPMADSRIPVADSQEVNKSNSMGTWNPAESKSVLYGELIRNQKTNDIDEVWRISNVGGSKFGTRVWPEVLRAAGINVEKLDCTSQYPLEDYTRGEYEKNERGYPRKVTLLASA